MRFRLLLCTIPLVFSACSTIDQQGTIAELRNKQIEITDQRLEGGLEKAMMSYHNFLVEAPDSALAPEAIRRLADLKVEKEYGLLTLNKDQADRIPPAALTAHETTLVADLDPTRTSDLPTGPGESDTDFAQRASDLQGLEPPGRDTEEPPRGPLDLERAGPLEAITLYRKLLNEYPLYDRNDQVLYQMSRAYEELGQIEDAMTVMNQLVRDYPQSP